MLLAPGTTRRRWSWHDRLGRGRLPVDRLPAALSEAPHDLVFIAYRLVLGGLILWWLYNGTLAADAAAAGP